MITPCERVDIVAFTKSDIFGTSIDRTKRIPYQRVVALWHKDGVFGQHVGDRNTSGRDERVLSLSPVVGARLMSVFTAIKEGRQVNCHWFSREISGMQLSREEPECNFEDLPVVDHLPVGSMGVIGVKGYGVPHSIGYGLGDESLQVMSAGAELGFADNTSVVEYYRRVYTDRTVNLHQVQ